MRLLIGRSLKDRAALRPVLSILRPGATISDSITTLIADALLTAPRNGGP
jgi:hypothetical protein